MSVRIAVFASGSGSNAENIAHYFENHPEIDVTLILANRKDAFVLERARKLGIPAMVFNREQFNTDEVLGILKEARIDFIVLAGFLWLVPINILEAFSDRILNIHPALLPKYGGKGMYGDRVHKAVKEAGDTETGITIHLVNDHYDEGQVVFQARCEIDPGDTPETIAQKVHELEYKYFPKIIEDVILNTFKLPG